MTGLNGSKLDSARRADLARTTLRRAATERGDTLAALSRLVGRNAAYLQQYLERGTPAMLPGDVRRTLAQHFGIDERLLGAHDPYQPAARDRHMPDLEGPLRRLTAFRASRSSGGVIDPASGLTVDDLDRIAAALHDHRQGAS